MTSSTLFYVHDPMCSWCWGHRPQWLNLQQALPDSVVVKNIVGGLAPDSDQVMPLSQQQAIAGYWKNIHELLGTQFNDEFWQRNSPRRSTYPACRAVIAARWQDSEEQMILALQQAYYLKAMNPSDTQTHILLAGELGLDVDKFTVDLASEELEMAFVQELKFARSLPINGFPSMVLQHRDEMHVIALDYKDCRGAIEQISAIIA
ncbi:MAG: DsbA family protein [Gammaproteobacteria bacterium]|nr:DsbA family protein [Gammaproteobacteria bacterium]